MQSRRGYQFQRPLLGERFAQLRGLQVMTRVYDLTISRSFHDESLSYTDTEEEVCTVHFTFITGRRFHFHKKLDCLVYLAYSTPYVTVELPQKVKTICAR